MIRSTKPHRSLAAVLAFLAVILNVNSICGQVSATERQALIDLYTTTGGPNWANNTNWNNSAPVREWYGVGISDNRVTSIQLPYNNLNGNFPNSILQLTYLKDLILEGNQISGELPRNNQGKLSNLRLLSLTNNKLTGRILQNLGHLPNLEFFYIGNNEFIFSDLEPNFGTFDTALGGSFGYSPQAKVDEVATRSVMTGNTITLSGTTLTSSNNRYQWYKDGIAISGATNQSFVISNAKSADAGVYTFKATNTKVTNLEIERNPITLVVESIEDCVSAEERQALIDLYNATAGDTWTNTLASNKPWLINNPGSSVCDWYGVSVTNGKVTKLELPNNSLNGEIPRSINQLPGLLLLTLHTNQLSGSIPKELGDLIGLRRLWLNKNELSGSIPLEIGQLINLQDFNLSLNQLSENIPAELGQLTNLRKLFLSDNQFTGNIPAEFGQLTNLITLNLHQNQLSGNIPVALGQLTKLITLNVYRNQISGNIPIEIGQLTNLVILNLFKNQLNGSIPTEIGQLINLRDLNLGSNQLSGNIPAAIGNLNKLTSLKLNGNQLLGAIPDTIQQLTLLQRLFLDNNSLRDKIPDISGFVDLNTLRMEKNMFVFSDFEPEFSAYKTKMGNNFRYMPQAKIDQLETQSVVTGGSITLTSNVLTSPNNSYQWYKNNRVITGATNKNLVISNASDTDAGVYFFRATNSVVTNLRLERYPITLSVVQSTDCVSATERQALIDLYNATFGGNWKNTLAGNKPWLVNDPNSSVCDWYGVGVVNGKITSLHLINNNLTGTISNSIGTLGDLRSLLLHNNKLTQEIPLTLGNLTKLELLQLSGNLLSGNIPGSIGQLNSLKQFLADRNQLSGAIPSSIGQLTNLQELNLLSNQLDGSIPAELGQLVNLKELNLYSNQITGNIPVTFGLLINLEELLLDLNQLSGDIPSELGKLNFLKTLSLSNNKLVGQIPSELGQLTDLESLRLSSNQLSGSIPSELGQLNNLKTLILTSNNLTGAIPSEFGQLTNLINLYLTQNQLSGSIPVSIGQLSKLSNLFLNRNQLSGNIPGSILQLTNLGQFHLQDNQIKGRIPDLSGITNLTSFRIIRNNFIFSDFETEFNAYQAKLGNNFSYVSQAKVDQTETQSVAAGGSITLSSNVLTSPNNSYQWYKDNIAVTGATNKDLVISNISNIDEGIYTFKSTNSVVTNLILERNPITLAIATSNDCVSAAERQALIDIYNTTDGGNWKNTLAGNKPWLINAPSSSVCDWYGVTVVDGKVIKLELFNNNLINEIPSSIGKLIGLQELYLTGNQLSGNIPTTLERLTFLKSLHLGNNKLTGSIPSELGSLINLQNLILSNNQLSGAIPSELGRLVSLINLHLGANKLSDSIPNSIANLSVLESLSLVRNQLSGPIPIFLNQLSKLEGLNLSINQFTGPIPIQLAELSSLKNLALNNNRLTGSVPIQFSQLTSLQYLRLSGNQLSGKIPNLSNLPFYDVIGNGESFTIDQNQFIFADFESEFIAYQAKMGANFRYAPQAKVDQPAAQSVALGESITLTSNVLTSPNNSFQWYKDGIAITGATNKDLVITDASDTDAGIYAFKAINSVVTNLELERNPITLTIGTGSTCTVSTQERQALIDLYNATNGDNWTNTLTGNKPWLINDPNSKVCDWYGITIINGSVTKLDLRDNDLAGEISNSIGQLINLKELFLFANQLKGTIPNELGLLLNLEHLFLDRNKLSGSIPVSLSQLTNLRRLVLSVNELTGGIPPELGRLTNLQELVLNKNKLSGSIPSELSQLTNLQNLSLRTNQLSGSIPIELGQLLSILRLDLLKNDLSGSIPKELGQLLTLETLNLNQNQLSGSIPKELGQLNSLKSLLLGSNRLVGTIPNELNQLSSLKYLNLGTNELVGDIPSWLAQLPLISISLSINKLSGSIPPELAQLTDLQQLWVFNNQLSGKIPDFSSIPSLERLSFPNNKFVFSDFESEFTAYQTKMGTNFQYIPQSKVDQSSAQSVALGESITLTSNVLTSPNNNYQWYKGGVAIIGATEKELLITDASDTDAGVYTFKATNSVVTNLELERNPITLTIGTGSACTVSTAERQALIDFYVATNGDDWTNTKNGDKPWLINDPNASVCDWYGVTVNNGKVTKLELVNNNLTGEMPISIKQFESLIFVNLPSNKLSGSIPKEIGQLTELTQIRLFQNQLTGNIPKELGQLLKLEQLHLSSNQLSGTIPKELGRLNRLNQLILGSNKLTGTIPKELGQLLNLKNLTLQINQLVGSIPKELGNLMKLTTLILDTNLLSENIPSELCQLIELQTLALQNNQLTGQIPECIGLINTLRYLFFQNNRLEGSIPIEFNQLSEIIIMRFEFNNISNDIYLDINQLPFLNRLSVYQNNFIFSDFESEFTAYQAKMGENFRYAPQAKVDLTVTQSVAPGGSITLTSNVLISPNNSYQWYKDGVAITGAIEKELVITNASDTDAGVYTFKATNSIVTNLELERNPITLVIGDPGGTDCTNLLDAFAVDTSFESAVSVVINGRNETLGATGWDIGEGTPDTFLPPFTTEPSGDPFISYTFNSAPNGGICAGALRRGNNTESFSKELSGLIPGTTYVVEFYQANATRLLIPELLEEAYGYWEVRLGSEPQYTTPMQPNSLIPAWQRARLEFTATTAIQRIEFLAASSAADTTNSYPVYVLIDGIRFYKKPQATDIACSDLEIQSFCNLIFEEPTVDDLVSPLTGTTSWYKEQIGGIPYDTGTLLSDLGTTIFWADNSSGASRVPIEVIFDLGAPDGDGYQSFDIYDTPTISDLAVTGENILWYATPTANIALLPITPLVHSNTYYAAQGTNSCRLAVEVAIQVPQPIGSGLQTFCSTTNPTVANLLVQPTRSEYNIIWYHTATGTQTYTDTTPLEHGKIYYATHSNGIEETIERFPVKVNIINTDSTPRIYERNVAVPLESTVGTLTSFFKLDTNMVWYNLPTGGRPYENTDILFDGKTYYARIGSEPCDASEIIAVTVQIGEIEQPERIRCIKFVPRPGDHYVISGWAREDALKAVDSDILNFETVSPFFLDLLTYLKDKVLNNESLPEVYILKSDPDAPDVDELLPFIKNANTKNVTVYDFKLEREITEGVKRTIGFSFSLDPEKTYSYTYITPEVTYDLFGISSFRLGYHFPLLNNPSLDIQFKKASSCGTNFCITSDFTIDSDNILLKRSYKDHISERSSISGIEPYIMVFTYEEDPDYQVMEYLNTTIELIYKDGDENVIPMDTNNVVFTPNGPIIDGWQRITADFKIPTNAANLTIALKNKGQAINAYFDDVRIYPFNGNMKSFVYDRVTQRLMAELDENNYATFYEYDKEGGLVRVKKETEEGVYTIQETRSSSSKINK